MNKTVKPISTFTILAMAFFGMGVGTITPALNAIFVQFSDLPITTLLLVSTLPSLTVIPATLIAGSVAGSKVKYRTLAIIGMTLFVLGGVAPYFATDFTVILLERAIFGIGLGIMSPLANSLVMGVYEGDKVASMTGMVTLAMNIGGMVLQFMGGYFAGIGWNYSFLPHALGVSFFMAGMNLFGFLSTYWIGAIAAITGDAVTAPIAVGACVTAAFFVIFMIINPLKPSAPVATERG